MDALNSAACFKSYKRVVIRTTLYSIDTYRQLLVDNGKVLENAARDNWGKLHGPRSAGQKCIYHLLHEADCKYYDVLHAFKHHV